MSQPTVSASLSKSVYAPGELMTLTVNYGDADTQAVKVTVQVTDLSGNTSAPVTVSAVIDPVTLTLTDATRTWEKVSDTGSVAVFTSVA
jgi:hypothetical protein